MKLATLRRGGRDGTLVVVSPDAKRFLPAEGIAPSLQAALDRWDDCLPKLSELARTLADPQKGTPLEGQTLAAPLPRAYEWIDGSAYINHIVLVRKARGAEPPPTLKTEPLVYQGGSGVLLGANDDIPMMNAEWGLDFEAEVCVVLGDTPAGVSAADAGKYIKLFMICNDVSLRNLIPGELAKGFGFFNSKPATAFSPFAITPDELGAALVDGRVHLPMLSHLNGVLAGDTNAGPEMHFSFHDLIQHVTMSRALTAGTILGSGTVSNADPARGVSCLAERRMREKIDTGEVATPFMKVGDHLRIEMKSDSGESLFGAIDQKVVDAAL